MRSYLVFEFFFLLFSIVQLAGILAMKGYSRIPIKKLADTTKAALLTLGHSTEAAEIITDTLMYAELRANNQGLIKLVTGGLNTNPSVSAPALSFESPVSAQVDGGRSIGMVVVHKAVTTAIQKAKATGISVVGCTNYGSATGALGAWAKMIADEGLIGIVLSQCSELMAPHGSYEPIFGTNPLAIGVPTKPRAQVLDMATSACAYYGLKMAESEGKSIPNDVAYDNKGYPTTDPSEALKGALRVFDRSYKGSHLALMVELLAGSLTGASMDDKAQGGIWGSLVIAIDPCVLGPGNLETFQANASIMCDRVKNAKRLPGEEGNGELYLPGERGDNVAAENERLGSIPIADNVFSELEKLAEGAPPPVSAL
mmetsp:Transcript_20812/g.34869  ORF Transcript_20812/g.34869 Transcript_20812/m.34869 type:complete len:370 (+) Transcript_20812:1-1110(+)